MIRTRFAPSPNGPLHLGHAYAAVIAHDLARAAGGEFLVRIEDIDGTRSRADLVAHYLADLAWLGLAWDGVVVRQSDRLAGYARAADRLRAMGLLYPCTCTRAEILAAAPARGPDGPVYPGTCRGRRDAPADAAWRLDVGAALARTGPLAWTDALAGPQQARPELAGDVVLVRKDAPASYHLAVTLDDAAQGITLVTRGADLFAATHVHRLLQALLGLPVPRWHHHGLLTGPDGRKLAKRRGSPGLRPGADRPRPAQRLPGRQPESGEEPGAQSGAQSGWADGLALANSLRAHHFPAGVSLAATLEGEP